MTLDASLDIRRHPGPVPDRDQALTWIDRWDAQQAAFFADREERFAVICDVVKRAVDRPDPLIVDLGCGPGSLSARLLARIPDARVVGVDADPLLLGLAESAYGDATDDEGAHDRASFRTVQIDLRGAKWWDGLGLDRAPDAIVSTTALHYLEPGTLSRVLRTVAGGLAEGGVFVDGDHLYEGAGTARPHPLDEVARTVAAGARERALAAAPPRELGEGWPDWWAAARRAPELAHLAATRPTTDLAHRGSVRATCQDYLDALRSGGCRNAGVVWQCGDDRVVVGLR